MEEIPAQIDAVASELQDTVAELARKRDFLPEGERLTHNAMRVIRCAECIFARPVFPGDDLSFMVTDVENCTAIGRATIQLSADKLVRCGALQKEEASATTLHHAPRAPYVYKPVALLDGTSFFRPEPKPRCQRTLTQALLERLTAVQGGVLLALSQLTAEGTTTVTQGQIRNHNSRGTLKNVLELFCRTEILQQVEERGRTSGRYEPATYEFTERGLWLMSQLSGSELPQPPPKIERKPLTADDLQSSVCEQVRENYDDDLRADIIATVVEHINNGVLQGGITAKLRIGYPKAEAAPLQFAPITLARLDNRGRLALAYYLNLEPLLNLPSLPSAEMKRLLELPDSIGLSQFIAKTYYNPLREALR